MMKRNKESPGVLLFNCPEPQKAIDVDKGPINKYVEHEAAIEPKWANRGTHEYQSRKRRCTKHPKLDPAQPSLIHNYKFKLPS
jgi:hypothetical protein